MLSDNEFYKKMQWRMNYHRTFVISYKDLIFQIAVPICKIKTRELWNVVGRCDKSCQGLIIAFFNKVNITNQYLQLLGQDKLLKQQLIEQIPILGIMENFLKPYSQHLPSTQLASTPLGSYRANRSNFIFASCGYPG